MPPSRDEPRRKRQRSQGQTLPADADAQSNEGEDKGTACQSCRKRKSRCSKQQPCRQCERLHIECVYDERQRPGLKTGAIEALTQRLTNLEQMFLGQALLFQKTIGSAPNNSAQSEAADDDEEPLQAQVARLKRQCLDTAALNGMSGAQASDLSPTATQVSALPEAANDRPNTLTAYGYSADGSATNLLLPPDEIVHELVEWYFENVHRWIPILHYRRFKDRLESAEERAGIRIILLAITSLCLRFRQSSGICDEAGKAMSIRYRHAVILRSMEGFSVESVQALVILAFDIVGTGQGPSTWSIIGSMARTVEHLRLNTEPVSDDFASYDKNNFLIRRMTFLQPARTWVEEEERRRVFWSVFMIDRFCSVATGWNNSVTGADVRRRLPCEGIIWRKEMPVQTPFFGGSAENKVSTPISEPFPSDGEDGEFLGGFAFCIQATDTLNLVTNFFLKRDIRFEGPQQVRMWLLRFKELDLRLIRWKLSLPEKWREASVLNEEGNLDPNLTLAHVTHNTAVVQLHQCVAFPATPFKACLAALPSASSAETCMAAACEIDTITRQFLQQSKGITHPQLAICLFIAGRVLLAHVAHNASDLNPAFHTILAALDEISERWGVGGSVDAGSVWTQNLASRLRSRLSHAKAKIYSNAEFRDKQATLDVSKPVYFEDAARSRAASVGPSDHHHLQADQGQVCAIPNPHSSNAAFPVRPMNSSQPPPLWGDDFNLFATFDPDFDFLTTVAEPVGEGISVDNTAADWTKSLEGMFDADFEHMLRVSTFTGNSSQP